MASDELLIEQVAAHDDTSRVIRLRGPLVISNLFALQTMLRAPSTASTILELAEVPYVDSAGLGVLVNSYVSHQKSGRRFLLVGVNERVGNLLKITKVDQIFEVCPSLADARRRLAH